MILPLIAFRNALRQKRRTILTSLTMVGGFALSSIAIGWSDGSYSYIINMFTRNQLGHIQIHGKGYLDRPSIYNAINDYEEVARRAQEAGNVELWAPRIFAAGLAAAEDESSPVRITGIDPLREEAVTRFGRKIVDSASLPEKPSRFAVLGKGLAQRLDVKPGSEVAILSQAADGSIANDIFTVTGLADTGNPDDDMSAMYIDISDAQELFMMHGRAHEIAVIVSDIDKVRMTAADISKKLDDGKLSVTPWQVFAADFYRAMQLDMQGMWIALLVIIMIVAIGVLNTVLMNVLERTKEYGVLKAIGTRPRQLFMLVMYEVQILAVASIAVGSVIGVAVNSLFSKHGITLPESFTFGGMEFSKMFSEVNARSMYIPALTILISSFLVSIPPALRAARILPVKAMRAK